MSAQAQQKYLQGYALQTLQQVEQLISEDRLASHLLSRYPQSHQHRNDAALYDYVMELKAQYLRKSAPLGKVVFDQKIKVMKHALGLHTYVSRVQGSKLKAKNEIRIAALFKQGPIEFLRMICVHELAHIREKDHNKAFYQLCCHMEPNYHQYEFDLRLYLTHMELSGEKCWE